MVQNFHWDENVLVNIQVGERLTTFTGPKNILFFARYEYSDILTRPTHFYQSCPKDQHLFHRRLYVFLVLLNKEADPFAIPPWHTYKFLSSVHWLSFERQENT